ncbi:hypothetical protein KR018_000368, partial [Drosophila ironensis]
KKTKEGLKAKALYKAALKIEARLREKHDLSPEESSSLKWAKARIKESRAYLAQNPKMKATGKGHFNKVEEQLAKRQRSQDEAKAEAPASKRPRYKPTPPPPPQTMTVSDIARRHLVVALVDRSDPNGRMKPEQWRAVESKLLVELVKRMEEPKSQPVAFGNARWLEGAKLLS